MKKMRRLKTELVVEDEVDVRSFTASAEVPPRIRALYIGADNYLVKPLGAASLRKTAAWYPSSEREVLSCLQRKYWF